MSGQRITLKETWYPPVSLFTTQMCGEEAEQSSTTLTHSAEENWNSLSTYNYGSVLTVAQIRPIHLFDPDLIWSLMTMWAAWSLIFSERIWAAFISGFKSDTDLLSWDVASVWTVSGFTAAFTSLYIYSHHEQWWRCGGKMKDFKLEALTCVFSSWPSSASTVPQLLRNEIEDTHICCLHVC